MVDIHFNLSSDKHIQKNNIIYECLVTLYDILSLRYYTLLTADIIPFHKNKL
jgi:hypothetical protein